jgi:hypothetical protein
LHPEHFPCPAPELSPKEEVWCLVKTCSRQPLPKDVEELVENVIRSISGIDISTRKLHGSIAIRTTLFFPDDCPMHAAINSVDVVESSVLDGVDT